MVAAAGPEFDKVTVKTTVFPTFGVGLFTDLASARSAASGFVDAVALLFAVFGTGLVASIVATRAAVQSRLLDALRAE